MREDDYIVELDEESGHTAVGIRGLDLNPQKLKAGYIVTPPITRSMVTMIGRIIATGAMVEDALVELIKRLSNKHQGCKKMESTLKGKVTQLRSASQDLLPPGTAFDYLNWVLDEALVGMQDRNLFAHGRLHGSHSIQVPEPGKAEIQSVIVAHGRRNGLRSKYTFNFDELEDVLYQLTNTAGVLSAMQEGENMRHDEWNDRLHDTDIEELRALFRR